MATYRFQRKSIPSELFLLFLPFFLPSLPSSVRLFIYHFSFQVKSAIKDLGKQTWKEKYGRNIVAKLKDPVDGFGNVSSWSAEAIDR